MNCQSIRRLTPSDIPAVWRINEQGLPGVGKVSPEAMMNLLTLSELPLGAWDGECLVGFVLCLTPGTPYGSLNYAWFGARYRHFLYVDRIAVAETHRNRGIGTELYRHVIREADRRQWPVAAEVSARPLNAGSMRFHARHRFDAVGTLEHPHQAVTMFLRPIPENAARLAQQS